MNPDPKLVGCYFVGTIVLCVCAILVVCMLNDLTGTLYRIAAAQERAHPVASK